MSTPLTIFAGPNEWPLEQNRGTWGMLLFIATEAMLFAFLFYSYFYLGRDEPRWPTGPAPDLKLTIPMTFVLLSSSFVLHRGERMLERNERKRARAWVLGTILMGVLFLGMQAIEYIERIPIEPPTRDAYTSIFYTTTSIHGAHVLVGLLMLTYVLILPSAQLGPSEDPPHHALRNASLYWHFVDLVWVFIFTILYLAPHLRI